MIPPKPLGVFWDIENCNVPSGKSAMAVCDLIRKQKCFEGHREIEFAVVCDATKEPKAVLDELDKAQVDIIHVVSNRKNAADDKLKQIMRRFADIHRQGSRIVLISGDVDFAADIADFKRRMCLSVILLHNANASESLLLAASEVYNFYEILSALPVKYETPALAVHDEITVSNLPSISDCSEDTITQILNHIAKQFGGRVTHIHGSHGSANLKFSSAEQARSFKLKYLHYKIQGRPINIHFCYKSRSRGKSLSQSPAPLSRNRRRTMSSSSRKGHASSEEYLARRFSSQDSDGDVKVEEEGSRNQDITESFIKLSLSKGNINHALNNPRYASDSSLAPSSDDENKEKRAKKIHSKVRSKLKLKNRKKSEATREFLNQNEKPKDYDDTDPLLVMDKLVEISRNLTLLIDTQLVRLDLIADLYKEKFDEDLRSIILDNDITKFINEFCTDLTMVDFNMVSHIVLRKGEFVQNYLNRVNDVLYVLQKENDDSPVSLSLFENKYRAIHGSQAYLDTNFAMRECPGIKKTSRAFGREFIELSPVFILGNEIVEVLTRRGGIIPIENIYGYYKSATGKNLDPTAFGFESLEKLLKNLDMFVKIMGKKKSIALKSIHVQQTERVIQQRSNPEQNFESGAAIEEEGDGTKTEMKRKNKTPDIIGEANNAVRKETEGRGHENLFNDQTTPTMTGYFSSGSSGKMKLTSFVNSPPPSWQRKDEKYIPKFDTESNKPEHKLEIVGGNDEKEDIITIEESLSEAESENNDGLNKNMTQSGLSDSVKREKKKNRLAANFGGEKFD